MSIPVIFENEKQFIVDDITARKYLRLFVGYRFVDGVLYRQYILKSGAKILVEGK
jgi:hypothetical protein